MAPSEAPTVQDKVEKKTRGPTAHPSHEQTHTTAQWNTRTPGYERSPTQEPMQFGNLQLTRKTPAAGDGDKDTVWTNLGMWVASLVRLLIGRCVVVQR